ncbi:hypothetical protein ACYT84_01020 [Ralstonia solanacearum]
MRRSERSDWLAIDDDDSDWNESVRHRLVATDPDTGLCSLFSQRELRSRIMQIQSSGV